jgi:hypothetical protein
MKKQLNVILLLGLCCQLINTKTPQGSYTITCKNITYNNGLLSATCKDVNQSPINTTLQIAPDATNVNNCNGQLCNGSRTGDWQCPANILANLPKQLATTTNYLTKIKLYLQILNLQNQKDPNSMFTNSTATALNTIKTLIPTPVPANLQWFSDQLNQALQLISQMTPQSGQQQQQQMQWKQQRMQQQQQRMSPEQQRMQQQQQRMQWQQQRMSPEQQQRQRQQLRDILNSLTLSSDWLR